jgi:hypothetical protein
VQEAKKEAGLKIHYEQIASYIVDRVLVNGVCEVKIQAREGHAQSVLLVRVWLVVGEYEDELLDAIEHRLGKEDVQENNSIQVVHCTQEKETGVEDDVVDEKVPGIIRNGRGKAKKVEEPPANINARGKERSEIQEETEEEEPAKPKGKGKKAASKKPPVRTSLEFKPATATQVDWDVPMNKDDKETAASTGGAKRKSTSGEGKIKRGMSDSDYEHDKESHESNMEQANDARESLQVPWSKRLNEGEFRLDNRRTRLVIDDEEVDETSTTDPNDDLEMPADGA